MFMPVVWGSWLAQRRNTMLVLIPLGVLLGQAFIAVGLILMKYDFPSEVYGLILAVGFVVFSLSRAGIGVAQHGALAEALPRAVTTGFVLIIACTHAIKAACQFLVPRVLAWGGLVALQLALLLPSAIPVLAGYFIASRTALLPVNMGFPMTWQVTPCEPEIPRLKSVDVLRSREIDYPTRAIWLIGLWRAIVIGLLHSLESVMNAFLVDLGASRTAAGTILGTAQTIAFASLFFVAPLGDCIGRRVLLVMATLMTFSSALAFADGLNPLHDTVGSAAVLGLAFAGVIAPVLPLALVPANSNSYSRDYGMLDSLFSIAQCLCMLVIGILREKFDNAFYVVWDFAVAGFGIAACIMIPLVIVAKG